MNKKDYFNSKYSNLNNFKKLKKDFKFILKVFDNKKIKFENKKIIDLACGNGSFIYHFKKKFKNNKFFGLDLDKKLINLNKKNKSLKGVEFYSKRLDNKFSNHKFDLITILGSLNLFQNQKRIINNLLKHLNKKGLLVANCWLNKNDIDVDLLYKIYFKKKNLNNSIYIKSYQDTKKFLKKKASKFEIIENNYLEKIKKSKKLYIYTIRINKKYFRTNDLQMIYHQYLIILQK